VEFVINQFPDKKLSRKAIIGSTHTAILQIFSDGCSETKQINASQQIM
jgi:hypothetical protein